MQILQHQTVIARVVIADVRGSAPREPGTWMLIMRDSTEGTIGGGQLEWQAIESARKLMNGDACEAQLTRLVLAADLGQCCGGVVEVWLERFTHDDLGWLTGALEAGRQGSAVLRSTIRSGRLERKIVRKESEDAAVARLLLAPAQLAPPRVSRVPEVSLLERLDETLPAVWLYGAGHVGQALARMMLGLPLRLTWIDGREGVFTSCPEGVHVRNDSDPVSTVATAPPWTFFLVMTHSHPLDFELCRAILARADFAWLGLIGSKSKAARFRSRLSHEGINAEAVARLVRPIGVSGIRSKWPAAIAVAVAAQLLQLVDVGAEQTAMPAATDWAPVFGAQDCGAEKCAQCGKVRGHDKVAIT